MKHAQFAVLIASLCLCSLSAAAQSKEKEPIAVLELGAAASRSLDDGSSGPTVAVEVTPIGRGHEQSFAISGGLLIAIP
jgi:hypothetical protein